MVKSLTATNRKRQVFLSRKLGNRLCLLPDIRPFLLEKRCLNPLRPLRVRASSSQGGSRRSELRRIRDLRPAKRQRLATAPHLGNAKADEALRERKIGQFRTVPDDLRARRDVQQIAAREVDEQQAGARVVTQIAQRIEEAIAAEFSAS